MKNSEEAIEKVLAGLRDSNAPAGMERRILEAAQNRALAGSRSGWRRLSPIWLGIQTPSVVTRFVACGVALAGIFALALAIPAIHRFGHTSAQSKGNSPPLASRPPVPPEVVAQSAQPPAPVLGTRSKRKTNTRRPELVRESVALREMRAPSRPEPPMPLTEQEKLLVRFVQTRSPEELAAINPMKWAVRDAEERAEFERFFGQLTNRRNE